MIYLCAELIKRYQWCEYFGQYFCQCCHSGHTAYIPGHILQHWDFTKYPVSNFARDLLEKLKSQALFSMMYCTHK